LGFNLKGFETPAFKVLNQPYDLINNQIIDVKSDFVNLLTHPSIILQAAYKSKSQGTKLEGFLRFFHQKMRGEKSDYVIELEEGEEFEGDLKEIVDYLHRALANEELLRQLQLENSTTKGIKDLEANLDDAVKRAEESAKREKEATKREKEALAKEKKALAKEKEERRQKELALAKEKEERRQKEEERRQKELALTKEKEKSFKLAFKMAKLGDSIEEIMEETGLTQSEIEEIKTTIL
jgi:septal ring factor EnvC (AmiA/AmiB activator)